MTFVIGEVLRIARSCDLQKADDASIVLCFSESCPHVLSSHVIAFASVIRLGRLIQTYLDVNLACNGDNNQFPFLRLSGGKVYVCMIIEVEMLFV